MNPRIYVLIGINKLQSFLRYGKIEPEATMNNYPQIDDNPNRLFHRTFTTAKYPEGRGLLVFLAFDRCQAEIAATLSDGEMSIKALECVVAQVGVNAICVYGFGTEWNVRGLVRGFGKSIDIEQHAHWFK